MTMPITSPDLTLKEKARAAFSRLPVPAGVRFVAGRLVRAIPLLFAVVLFNFALLQLAPGDAAEVLAGESGSATAEYLADLKARFGLDQPVHVQLANYVWRLVQLDLGFSFRHNEPVLDLLLGRLPATLLLMISSVVLAVAVGALLGVLAASRVNSWRDNLISVFAMLSFATPVFWLGLMMIVLFSVNLGWLPSSGMASIAAGYTGIEAVLDVARHMVMPVVTLAMFYVAVYTRVMRAAMLEVFNQDYVTTARAKGLSQRRITWRHVVRNALLPLTTLLGVQIGTMLGGSVLVETVFSWPGLGRLAFEAVYQRDVNLLLGILLMCSVLVVVTNILVDLAYTRLDPRIRIR
ncbi:binding-protein-dependent transport system inner membrane protein [Stappia sp. 22II-S9-Z10]|nr:binding-protein-dependent transport system inner membrane protein [Stappia sp. 22II-S9-Z10]